MTALDGLRAVAVAAVMLGHLAPTYVGDGGVGVDLFFALSGYLITSILAREFEVRGDISFKHFYFRRTARLMPALALLLVVACMAVWLAPGHAFGWQEILYAGTYTMNWARAFGVGDSAILGHTWSLGVEEQFYLLWPPILLWVLRWRPKAAAVVAMGLALASVICSIGLSLGGATAERIYNGFDTRAAELLLGCAAAFLPLDSRFANLLARLWFLPVLALVADLCLVDSHFLYLGGFGERGLIGAWLIIALRKRSWLVTPLENPIVVYMGRISYGLYLWHYLILGICEAYGLQSVRRDIVVVAATFIIAALSYHFVEAPILNMTTNRFFQSLRPSSKPT